MPAYSISASSVTVADAGHDPLVEVSFAPGVSAPARAAAAA
ncbi:MAG: hypothetical protein V9E94_17215 [Microthrixaceae bacterium]